MKPMATSELTAMRQAFETRWWKLEDSETPARSYLEMRSSDLEAGDLRAESLTIIITREEIAR